MKLPFSSSMGRFLRTANRWLLQTPDRALDQAYDAALMIKAIEDQHFDGGKITTRTSKHSDNVLVYFQSELKKNLKLAEIRLTEFRASRVVVDSTNSTLYNRPRTFSGENYEHTTATLEKLAFIDDVLDRYKSQDAPSKALVPIAPGDRTNPNAFKRNLPTNSTVDDTTAIANSLDPLVPINADDGGMLDKTGVLPRSIVGTLNRIKRDLDPNSEQEVVRDFRSSKTKTLISIRLILLLIIIPLLTQQLSKTFLVSPIVDRLWHPNQANLFINFELEEAALSEFNTFKERLEFDRLLGRAPEVSGESSEAGMEAMMKEKVQEIAKSYAKTSANAIKNVFADGLSIFAFAVVLLTNRRSLEILKSFMDETVYGLSDSAKAFIIILFTDIFVGFHSPHGWEVLLEGVAKHLGLPPSRDFIFLFIATFPVILDTIFKYWIFRYLNRISPSAVATYKNMNE